MPCCRRSELSALICFAGTLTGGALKIRLENGAVADRIVSLLKEILGLYKFERLRPGARGGWYTITISKPDQLENLADGLGLIHNGQIALFPSGYITDFDCCKLSFIRGAFLGGGSIISPEKNYHMEFVTKTPPLADKLLELLQHCGIAARLTVRKNNFVVYIKESEAIAELLGLMGAGSSMMELYNVKIERELRNTVNRQVNCDSANLTKTTAAATRQLGAINRIAESVGLDELPQTLREIAYLRLQNPELPLRELGALANPPIGKSGVNHRMNRLIKYAEQLKPPPAGPDRKSGRPRT